MKLQNYIESALEDLAKADDLAAAREQIKEEHRSAAESMSIMEAQHRGRAREAWWAALADLKGMVREEDAVPEDHTPGYAGGCVLYVKKDDSPARH